MASVAAGVQTRGCCDNKASFCHAGRPTPCSVWPGAGGSGAGCTAPGARARRCTRRALVGGRAIPALRSGAVRSGLVAAGAGRSIAAAANGGAREQQTPVCDAPGASQGRVVARRAALAARKPAARRCTAAAHSQTTWASAGATPDPAGTHGAVVCSAGHLVRSIASCDRRVSGAIGACCRLPARCA